VKDTFLAALGEAFDPRPFHDTILGIGAVPLTTLEEHMDRYVAEALAKTNGQ